MLQYNSYWWCFSYNQWKLQIKFFFQINCEIIIAQFLRSYKQCHSAIAHHLCLNNFLNLTDKFKPNASWMPCSFHPNEMNHCRPVLSTVFGYSSTINWLQWLCLLTFLFNPTAQICLAPLWLEEIYWSQWRYMSLNSCTRRNASWRFFLDESCCVLLIWE